MDHGEIKMNELPHSSCVWFIEKRNIIKTDRWDGTKIGREACPACGGSGRIWFEQFVDWTCICSERYRDPIVAEWWKHDTTKYTSWLNELIWRWQNDFMRCHNIAVDVWIDDSPGWIVGIT